MRLVWIVAAVLVVALVLAGVNLLDDVADVIVQVLEVIFLLLVRLIRLFVDLLESIVWTSEAARSESAGVPLALPALYSPNVGEGEFSDVELRNYGVLGSSQNPGPTPVRIPGSNLLP
jgi:hypothetical protein